MTTEAIRYVDPEADVGGDGTTNALTGGTCAYVSLNVWEAARQRDLTAATGDDSIEHVYCASNQDAGGGPADTTVVWINGWATDADHPIIIEGATSHGGVWSDDLYRHQCTNEDRSIGVFQDYVHFIGLQLSHQMTSNTTGSIVSFHNDRGAGSLVDRCILKALPGTVSARGGIQADYSIPTAIIRNCLFYDFRNGSNQGYGHSIWGVVQNCTHVNCAIGGYANSFTNSGFAGCDSYGDGTRTTCSTDTPTFVDADNDDFHLAAEDTTWRSQGTDLSAYFTDDIDGDTRTAWSIGADDGKASGPSFVWLPMYGHKTIGLGGPVYG